mmetsp:Transcript_7901/g.24249  ORF Transcript_7901/g.24249 Transcript_7901/m.24249 type:complete len:292 (-) Transcript_7901:111-986(-)
MLVDPEPLPPARAATRLSAFEQGARKCARRRCLAGSLGVVTGLHGRIEGQLRVEHRVCVREPALEQGRVVPGLLDCALELADGVAHEAEHGAVRGARHLRAEALARHACALHAAAGGPVAPHRGRLDARHHPAGVAVGPIDAVVHPQRAPQQRPARGRRCLQIVQVEDRVLDAGGDVARVRERAVATAVQPARAASRCAAACCSAGPRFPEAASDALCQRARVFRAHWRPVVQRALRLIGRRQWSGLEEMVQPRARGGARAAHLRVLPGVERWGRWPHQFGGPRQKAQTPK